MPKRSGYHRLKALILYSCGHEKYFYEPIPKRGQEVLCISCQRKDRDRLSGWVTVVKQLEEYYFHCVTCHYAGYYGTNGYAAAGQAAHRHYVKYPTHNILEYNGKKLLHEYEPQEEKLFCGDIPF